MKFSKLIWVFTLVLLLLVVVLLELAQDQFTGLTNIRQISMKGIILIAVSGCLFGINIGVLFGDFSARMRAMHNISRDDRNYTQFNTLRKW